MEDFDNRFRGRASRGKLLVPLGFAALLAAIGSFSYYRIQAALSVANSEEGLRKVESRRLSAMALPVRSVDFMRVLPDSVSIDEVVRDLARSAQQSGVAISSASVEQRAATLRDLAHVQVSIVASADYRAAKTWLDETLSRYPSLGVSALSMRTASSDTARQEVRVVLVLYVRS